MTTRPPRTPSGRCRVRAATTAVVAACCAATSACTGDDPRPAPSTEPVRVHSAAATSPGAEAGTKTAAGGCRIVSATTVARHFGGRVASQSTGSTPLGQPMCSFVVRAPGLGSSGVVSAVETARSSAAAFTHARSATRDARAVDGIGDRAFYVPATGTLTFLARRTLVLVHAQFRVPGGPTRHAARLRADLVALSRSIASTL